MPRVPRHALTWSPADGRYALHDRGQAERCFPLGDEAAWQAGLGTVTTFAFHGATGSLNVYHEARPRGGRYWYAYHSAGGHTGKRYLGQTAAVTFARLEEVAAALAAALSPAPTAPAPTRACLTNPAVGFSVIAGRRNCR